MVDIDKAVVASLKKENRNFEILVDCEKAMDFKKGILSSVRDVLAIDSIFKDAQKGELASGLIGIFNTEDVEKISEEIIKKGEIQLTADYRKKLFEERRRQVVSLISRNAMDSRTKTPIPEKRVELAMEQAKVNIDPNKTAEEQMNAIVDLLRPIIPIIISNVELDVVIPANYSAKAYNVVSRFGKPKKDLWLNDGAWKFVIEIPAGIQTEFMEEMNKLTKGEVKINILGGDKSWV